MKYSRHRTRSRRVKRSVELAGAVVRGLAFLVLVGICVAGIRWIADGSRGYAYQLDHPPQAITLSFSALAGPHPGEIRAHNRRLVYPYSASQSTQGRKVAHRRPDYGAYTLWQSGIGSAPGEHLPRRTTARRAGSSRRRGERNRGISIQSRFQPTKRRSRYANWTFSRRKLRGWRWASKRFCASPNRSTDNTYFWRLYRHDKQQLQSSSASATPATDGAGAWNHSSSALWSGCCLR